MEHPATFEFQPETAASYEAGLKSTLWEGRARLNFNIFTSTFDNLQVSAFNGTTFTVGNAAKARSCGAEIDTEAVLAPGFTVRANLSYLDAVYIDFPGSACYSGQTAAQGSLGTPALPDMRHRAGHDPDRVILSVFGTTQPQRISAYIRDSLQKKDDGMVQRFQLLAWPDFDAPFCDVDHYPNAEAQRVAFQCYDRLAALDPSRSVPSEMSLMVTMQRPTCASRLMHRRSSPYGASIWSSASATRSCLCIWWRISRSIVG